MDQLWILIAQLVHVAFDGLVRTAKRHLCLEILMDSLRRQPCLHLGQDQGSVRLAKALSPVIPGGRKWVSLVLLLARAKGRRRVTLDSRVERRQISGSENLLNYRLGLRRFQRPHVAANGIATEAQFPGDLANRPAQLG